MLHNRLKSRNVHSEIVFSFSSNNNVSIILDSNQRAMSNVHPLSINTVLTHTPAHQIADSFRRFGISPTTTSLLAIKVAHTSADSNNATPTFDAVQTHLTTSVEGTPIAFTDESLQHMTDMQKVRKLYKLDSGGGAKKGAKTNGTVNGINDVDERKEIESVVLGMMALKGS